MKISDLTQDQAEAVRDFLLAWQQMPRTRYGLCLMSYSWMHKDGRRAFAQIVGHLVSDEFGPLNAYPFNEDNCDLYEEEVVADLCSQNPARRAWVAKTLDQVTQHLALLGAQANVQP